MTLDDALGAMRDCIEPGRAQGAAAYHKQTREVMGVPNPALNALTQNWRRNLTMDACMRLADELWRTDIFEARIASAKVLTKARITPDDAVWDLIAGWVPEFDSWAISDHACMAGRKRLEAAPARIAQVENWTHSGHMWTRRAALVMTLPWTRMRHPKPTETAIREQVLGWAARYVTDPDWFIQKAVAWWLRDLSKRDAARVHMFLDQHGDRMKPFARREAAKYLPDG